MTTDERDNATQLVEALAGANAPELCDTYHENIEEIAANFSNGYVAETNGTERDIIARDAAEASAALNQIAGIFLDHVDEIRSPGAARSAATSLCNTVRGQ